MILEFTIEKFCLIVLSIVILYAGVKAGVVGLILFGLYFFIFYKPFPFESFFWYILFTLIFSEFHFLWTRKIRKLKEEKNYLEYKIDDIGKNLYLLKISHDQLERNYILKPLSIRASLNEIREKLITKDSNLYSWFLIFISRIANIDSASLYIKSVSGFDEVANVGGGVLFKEDDILIKRVFENKTNIFISLSEVIEEKHTDYLCIVPATDNKDEIIALLLIKEIPFLSLNKDNVFTISLFMTYFFTQVDIVQNNRQFFEKVSFCDPMFIDEMNKLCQIRKKIGTESTLLELDLSQIDIKEDIFSFLETKIRVLDMLSKYEKPGVLKIFVILPLTSIKGTIGFAERMKREVQDRFGKHYAEKISHKFFPVKGNPNKIFERILSHV